MSKATRMFYFILIPIFNWYDDVAIMAPLNEIILSNGPCTYTQPLERLEYLVGIMNDWMRSPNSPYFWWSVLTVAISYESSCYASVYGVSQEAIITVVIVQRASAILVFSWRQKIASTISIPRRRDNREKGSEMSKRDHTFVREQQTPP